MAAWVWTCWLFCSAACSAKNSFHPTHTKAQPITITAIPMTMALAAPKAHLGFQHAGDRIGCQGANLFAYPAHVLLPPPRAGSAGMSFLSKTTLAISDAHQTPR
jgi:hypothetical protein